MTACLDALDFYAPDLDQRGRDVQGRPQPRGHLVARDRGQGADRGALDGRGAPRLHGLPHLRAPGAGPAPAAVPAASCRRRPVEQRRWARGAGAARARGSSGSKRLRTSDATREGEGACPDIHGGRRSSGRRARPTSSGGSSSRRSSARSRWRRATAAAIPRATCGSRRPSSRRKAANMPADNIKRAVQKGTGELPGRAVRGDHVRGLRLGRRGRAGAGAHRQQEPHGPRDPAHLREARAATWARRAAWRGCSSAAGMIQVDAKKIKEDELLEKALDAGAADVKQVEKVFEITTTPDEMETVRQALERAGRAGARGAGRHGAPVHRAGGGQGRRGGAAADRGARGAGRRPVRLSPTTTSPTRSSTPSPRPSPWPIPAPRSWGWIPGSSPPGSGCSRPGRAA